MKSKEKEEILLTKPVKCTSKIEVERWLDSLTTEMKVTVRKILQTGQKEYTEEGRKDWVLKHGGQVVAAVAQIQWCSASEDAINEMPVDPLSL